MGEGSWGFTHSNWQEIIKVQPLTIHKNRQTCRSVKYHSPPPEEAGARPTRRWREWSPSSGRTPSPGSGRTGSSWACWGSSWPSSPSSWTTPYPCAIMSVTRAHLEWEDCNDPGPAVAGEGPGGQHGPAVPGLDHAACLPRPLQHGLRPCRGASGSASIEQIYAQKTWPASAKKPKLPKLKLHLFWERPWVFFFYISQLFLLVAFPLWLLAFKKCAQTFLYCRYINNSVMVLTCFVSGYWVRHTWDENNPEGCRAEGVPDIQVTLFPCRPEPAPAPAPAPSSAPTPYNTIVTAKPKRWRWPWPHVTVYMMSRLVFRGQKTDERKLTT